MKHRNSHFAVGYWSRIRQGRDAPDQADIDPKALKRLLPFVFLLDGRGGQFTYRLAGTTLCERYGCELRGRDYFFHWDPDSRIRLGGLLRQSLHKRVPLCLNSVGATENCQMVEIETVLMPMTFGGEEPERFLGVAQVLGDMGSLAGQPITFERLISAMLVREDDHIDLAPPPPAAGKERWPAHPRAPHLRLVTTRKPANASDPLRLDENQLTQNLSRLMSDLLKRVARGF